MRANGITVKRIGALCVTGLFALYLISIVWVNLNAGQWYNFDIYADAMVAKYMAQSKTLFPESWTFGNQFYVIATPVLAALIYCLVPDATAALGIASCIMTVLVIWSFCWCLKPFVDRRHLAVGLLCLIGGTCFGTSAARDAAGLQIFYTMGSYYACYVIGILFTLGIWLRLRFCADRKIAVFLPILCGFVNFALGMQSLREMLVLELPLCALAFLLTLTDGKKKWLTKDHCFCTAMLLSGLAGVITIKVLTVSIPIHQNDILEHVDPNVLENMRSSLTVFLNYIGFTAPAASAYWLCKVSAAIALTGIVVFVLADMIRKKRTDAMGCLLLFCVISLMAVFCAGALIIKTRGIYYFVWHILLALSFIYILEEAGMHQWIRRTAIVGLLAVSLFNYAVHFGSDIRDYKRYHDFYEETARWLAEEGVSCVYYDVFSVFDASGIGACSDDQIICGAIGIGGQDRAEGDMTDQIKYLWSSEWFTPEHASGSYLLVSDKGLEALGEYKETFLSHLSLKRHAALNEKNYYFYSFDEEVFRDIISD